MNAKKCDRCGEYYDKNVNPAFSLGKRNSFNDYPNYVDLCKKCTDELEEWFHAEKIEKVKEILKESEVINNEN